MSGRDYQRKLNPTTSDLPLIWDEASSGWKLVTISSLLSLANRSELDGGTAPSEITIIKLRKDTESNWASNNPILSEAEAGYVLGKNYLKIGDGITPWNTLPPLSSGPDATFIFSIYSASITYSTNSLVSYSGELFIALQETTGDTPVGGTSDVYWKKLLIQGTEWDNDVIYPLNYIVGRNGVLYLSLVPGESGNDPELTTGTKWEEVRTGGGVDADYTSGEAVAIRTPVMLDTGKFYIADIDDSFPVLGFTTSASVGADETIRVQYTGELDGFAGLTAGTTYYLGNSGALVTKGALSASDRHIRLGLAISTTTMFVDIFEEEQIPGGNGLQIGMSQDSPVKSGFPGFLQYAFDNAKLIANYPLLYAKVGEAFNAQHVAAGDADLSGSGTHFYPTPVPGRYTRTAIPDIVATFSDDTDLLATGPGWVNAVRVGTAFVFLEGAGTAPTGLTDGTTYYLRPSGTGGTATIHPTEADAIADTNAIAYTDSGSGTLTFSQEGLTLEDAFQGHGHVIDVNTGSPSTGDLDYLVAAGVNDNAPASSADMSLNTVVTDGANGTPRTSNETRATAIIEYRYIKALEVSGSGDVIVAPVPVFDSDWVANSDWTGNKLLADYSLIDGLSGLSLKDVHVKFVISTDGTDANSFTPVQSTSGAGGYGYTVHQNGTDEISINTGAPGLYYIDGTPQIVAIIAQAWYYRIIITPIVWNETLIAQNYFAIDHELTEIDISTTNQETDLDQFIGQSAGFTIRAVISGGDGTANHRWRGTSATIDNIDPEGFANGVDATAGYNWQSDGQGVIYLRKVGVAGVNRWVTFDTDVWDTINETYNSISMPQIKYIDGRVDRQGSVHQTNLSESDFWDELSPVIPNTNDAVFFTGNGLNDFSNARAVRTDANTITIYGHQNGVDIAMLTLTSTASGSWADTTDASIFWKSINTKWTVDSPRRI